MKNIKKILGCILTCALVAPIESAYAQNTNQFQMSEDDINFGADNDVNFAEDNQDIPMFQKQSDFTPSEIENKNSAPIEPQESLTQTLQQAPATSPTVKLPDVSGTWVDKLATSVPNVISGENAQSAEADNADNSLQSLINDSRTTNRRSNASVFDISGVMLRMTLPQAEKAMLVRGFKPVSQKMEIPNFIRWRNEEKCRGNGVVGYERLMNCVVEMAKKKDYQYVEYAKFVKYSTKEEIEINLTSNFTGNKIYRIMYKSMSGNVTGSGAKAAYLRNIKVFDFWKKVNQKYGTPDNKDEVTWGLGVNKPYMKASTGFLVLEDPMLRELDYTRMSREDQRFMNTDLYSF